MRWLTAAAQAEIAWGHRIPDPGSASPMAPPYDAFRPTLRHGLHGVDHCFEFLSPGQPTMKAIDGRDDSHL